MKIAPPPRPIMVRRDAGNRWITKGRHPWPKHAILPNLISFLAMPEGEVTVKLELANGGATYRVTSFYSATGNELVGELVESHKAAK